MVCTLLIDFNARSAVECPSFIDERRSRRLQKIPKIVADIARLVERADVSRSLIQGWEKSLDTAPDLMAIRLKIVHEKALLGTWELRLGMKREQLRMVAVGAA
jgi:hypothetical protein